MNDYELLQGIKMQDEACYQELVRKYTRYVAAVVSKIGGIQLAVQEKEEISWEVFVRVWEKAQHIEVHNESLKNYLGIVARNLTLNTLRRKEKLIKQSVELESINYKSAEEEFFIQDTLESIKRFIRKTKEPDKEIFVSRYFYLERVKDIANRLGMNEKNVSARLARLRSRLKEVLEKGEC